MVKETVYERRGRGSSVAHLLAGAERKLRSVRLAVSNAGDAAEAVEGSDGGKDPIAPFTDYLIEATTSVARAIADVSALYELAKEVAKTELPKTEHGKRREYDATPDAQQEPQQEEEN